MVKNYDFVSNLYVYVYKLNFHFLFFNIIQLVHSHIRMGSSQSDILLLCQAPELMFSGNEKGVMFLPRITKEVGIK